LNTKEFNLLRERFHKAFEGNDELFPLQLKVKHPRVISDIVILWGSTELDGFLNDLLLNSRSAKNGFSDKVMTEIVTLLNFHSRLFPKTGKPLEEITQKGPDSNRVEALSSQPKSQASPGLATASELVTQPVPKLEPKLEPPPVSVPDVTSKSTIVSAPIQVAAPKPKVATAPVTAPAAAPKITTESKPAAQAGFAAASVTQVATEPKPTSPPGAKSTPEFTPRVEPKTADALAVQPKPVQKAAPAPVPTSPKVTPTQAPSKPPPESNLAQIAKIEPVKIETTTPEPKVVLKGVSAPETIAPMAFKPAPVTKFEISPEPPIIVPAAPLFVQKSTLRATLDSAPKPSPQPAFKPTAATAASPKQKFELEPIQKAAVNDKANFTAVSLTHKDSIKVSAPQVDLKLEPLTAGQWKSNSAAKAKTPGKPEKAKRGGDAAHAAMHLDEAAFEQQFLNAFVGNEAKIPRKLKEKYPRIYRKIILLWGSPETDDYLDDLMLDTRGDRQGFPEEVMAELFELQTFQSRFLPSPLIPKKPDTSGITTVEQLQEALDNESTPQFDLKLGEALVREQVITRKQLKTALADQVKNKTEHLGKSLIKLGFSTEEEIERIAAKRLGFAFVNLGYFHVWPDAMKLVPREAAMAHKAIPLCILGSRLVVAVENPLAFQGREFLSVTTGKTIVLVGSTLKNINAQLNIYGEDKTAEEKYKDMQSFIDSATEEYGNVALGMDNVEEELQFDEAETDVSDNSLVKLRGFKFEVQF
jgi:hypothetical protein